MQCLAQLTDAVLENTIAYERPRPNGVEHLLFCDEQPRVLDQQSQNRKCFRAQGDRVRFVPQAFVREIETKSSERDFFQCLHFTIFGQVSPRWMTSRLRGCK